MVSDDLILLSMAMEHYSTESLPGIWAIEALACSKQPNTSVLIDLIRRTPDLTADIGKNARELVCFKLLETFSVEGNQNNNEDASALCQKIEFDPSDSCEDVLGHILQEVSASNFKHAASKMLKWDVKSFIAHKRHCLPIFALQKLKDAVLEGSHSVFASLKERSGVEVRTKFNDIPGLGVSHSASGQIPELSNKAIQIVCPNQNLSTATAENGVEELQEKLPGRNSLLSKRKKIDISSENLEREDHIMQDYCSDPYAESTKKSKQDTHTTQNTAAQKSIKSARDGFFANFSDRITKDIDREGYNSENVTEIGVMDRRHTRYPFDAGDQPAAKKLKHALNVTEHATVVKSVTTAGDEPLHNSSERTIEHTNREGCNLEKEAEVGVMDTSHSEGGNRSALMMITRSSEMPYDGGGNSQLQDRINDNTEVNIPGKVQGRSNCADKANDYVKVFDEKATNGSSLGANEDHDNSNEAINSFHQNVQGNTSTGCEANDSIEHNQVLEVAIDHDNFHDERNDIATKKKAFLTSQCTSSEDSLATQRIFCVKCDKGGQLLTCGSSTCPLVVHESCLGTAAKFDDGIFYCPFCMYSRAISECLEAKKKVTLARKDLATFIDLKVGRQPQLPVRSRTSKQNKVRQVDELCENNEANTDRDPPDEIIHTHMRPNVEDNLQTRPSTSVAVNGLPGGQTVGHLTHGDPEILENEDLHGEGTGQQCQFQIQPGEEQNEVQTTKKSDPDIPSHNQADIPKRNGRQAVRRVQKKVKQPPESPISSESFNQTTSESSEEDDKSSSLKYSMRSRRPKMQYTHPAFPMLRRKRCLWTKLEEEKLKEGVGKFSNHLDSNIPWKTILEFGTGVFEKGRTAVDLKDKWRNMSKGGSIRS